MSNEYESKILFAIYRLYKSEQINEEQRGELKDLLITKNNQIMNLLEPYEEALLTIFDNHSDATSLCSQKSYKNLRPSKLDIRPAYRKSLQDISQSINHQSLSTMFKKKKFVN
ncbi:unnamed protein product (macronuclear) [Paramecium tetraurelia]|uniref:Uncharacterized protein n=1 Tax=Paramecium tetraurelia TaxID=5888 RepID=A0CP19_PARTE|nr:uncharacterized protein GSPATT00008927001 [Paramecium tetraurelia]CAK72536.1 unnamed protein product [Paramecium tetraurelia]|eukprot:XP_001439933.1 hypothetical protein (macronuclear) [Paramecium tetraurelia strain d4-2]